MFKRCYSRVVSEGDQMTIRAKYDGHCRYCNGVIRKGTLVGWEPLARRGKGVWHQGCAPSGDPKADAEYMAGIADGNRYLNDKKIYGAALAEKWAAEEEFNRYWKYGEDY